MSKVSLTSIATALVALSLSLATSSAASSCRFATSSGVLAQRVVRSTVESQIGDYIFEKAEWVFENATSCSYKHSHRPAKDQVRAMEDGGGCCAETDCSGFISYVLQSAAPRQYQAVRRSQPERPYPQAKAYVDFFAQLSPDVPFEGWVRVTDFRALKKGDIIAWKKAQTEESQSQNTGHVMLVTTPPRSIREMRVDGKTIRYIEVPVLDSSSVTHFSPEELPPLTHQNKRDGLGKGIVRIIIGDGQMPIGYWEGMYWGEGGKDIDGPTYTKEIEFARLVQPKDGAISMNPSFSVGLPY